MLCWRAPVSVDDFHQLVSPLEERLLQRDDNFAALPQTQESTAVTPADETAGQDARIEASEKRFQERSQHFQMRETPLEVAVVRLSQADVIIKQSAADVCALENWRESAAKAQNDLEQAI
jgi:hypothetical protein